LFYGVIISSGIAKEKRLWVECVWFFTKREVGMIGFITPCFSNQNEEIFKRGAMRVGMNGKKQTTNFSDQ